MGGSASLEKLAAALRGDLVLPEHEAYDRARALWNGMADSRPAAIARCTGVADVKAAVGFARDHGLKVTVRAGGHGVAGRAIGNGALVVDLSLMRHVAVDPERRIAHVSAGAKLGDLDHEAQAFGLATTAGIDSRTGVAGLTLGGGLGFLARRFGLTVDNLRAVELVLPDGRFLRASDTDHPDLLWAARGGRGVGVITRFELALHPVGPEVLVAQAFHPGEQSRGALRFYRDLMAEAPDDFACYALYLNLPPDPAIPAEHHGTVALAMVACCSGGSAASGDNGTAGDTYTGAELVRRVASFGTPIAAAEVTMPYTVLQSSFDAGAPDGARYYWKNHFLRELPDEAIDVFAGLARTLPGPFTVAGFEPLGGAIARVDPGATAFPHRHHGHSLGIWAGWENPDDDDAAIAWTRSIHEALAPYATGGAYSNYLDRDDQERTGAAFGTNASRLREIRRRYDPEVLIG